MGLCKCPKKKVTTLFCFEHTVNVCEHCLVSDHPQCIVQSYLRWLQDSDYDPTCRLCGKNLADASCGPCVRLVCYDVFHWSCLNNYEKSLPPNTAPAGYTCPICSACIFPSPNASSPVIEALVKFLSSVNWARTGLGLPLIEEKPSQEKLMPVNQNGSLVSVAPPTQINSTPSAGPMFKNPYQPLNSTVSPTATTANPSMQSALNIDESFPYPRVIEKNDLFLSGPPITATHSNDHDMDKYRRRPAMQWFARWFSNTFSSQQTSRLRHQPSSSRLKRYIILFFIVLIAFVTVVLIFNELGKYSADDDPLLDPMANPNIRVQD